MFRILRLIFNIFQFFLPIKRISYFGTSIVVPGGLDWRTRAQIFLRRYEKPEIESILKICDDSTSILEIGGGCGILAAVVDKNISPKRHDIYEPIKLNIERIKSQDLLTTTSIFENAVVSSDDSEKNLFFRERERVFGSGFYSEGQISLDSDKFSEVQKKSIDKILSFKNDYDLILVDVEGYEDKLLPEICNLSNAKIIFEFHQDKCDLNLSEIFQLCPEYKFNHYSESTFIGFRR